MKENFSKRSIASIAITSVAIAATGCYMNSSGPKLGGQKDDFENESFSEYLNFIAKYGKTKMNSTEFYHRYDIFKSNYNRIIDHNKIPDSGFELEVNKFADMTDEEFVKQNGRLMVPHHMTEKFKDQSLYSVRTELQETESSETTGRR